jgi:hypothetical protein
VNGHRVIIVDPHLSLLDSGTQLPLQSVVLEFVLLLQRKGELTLVQLAPLRDVRVSNTCARSAFLGQIGTDKVSQIPNKVFALPSVSVLDTVSSEDAKL